MPVRFEFIHPQAVTVAIAGTFNGWNPTTIPMHSSGNGHWVEEAALAPGSYEYCLVVDGQWMPDPLAKNIANPFGGRNSILEVAFPPDSTHFVDAKNGPLKNAVKSKIKNI